MGRSIVQFIVENTYFNQFDRKTVDSRKWQKRGNLLTVFGIFSRSSVPYNSKLKRNITENF